MRVVLIVLFLFTLANAKGVKAGTVITNQSFLSFSIEGSTIVNTISSNIVKSKVLQVLNSVLKWQDSKAPILYEAGENVIHLSLRNDGNGEDKYRFDIDYDQVISSIINKVAVYEDSNKNGYFDSLDTKVTNLKLDIDKSVSLFLVTKLKDSLSSYEKDNISFSISAISLRGGSGIKGKLHAGQGVDGVDAIDGINGGIAKDNVYYLFKKQVPTFKKEVKYFEKEKYFLVNILFDVSGDGEIKNFTLFDDIPKGVRYRKNSLKLNKKYQTDKKDSDTMSYDFRLKRVYFKTSKIILPHKYQISYIVDKEDRWKSYLLV